jgi:hypothetical protein
VGTDATLTDVLPTSDVAADDAVAGRAARGVLLRLGSSRYAVAMADVAEVAAVPGVTRVPGSAPWLSGVANWRGRMLPVLDLRPLLDTPTVPLASSARLVVLARADVVVGLVVEAEAGVAAPRVTLELRDDDGVVLGSGKASEDTGEESGGKTEHANLPGVFPDACKWLKRLPGRSPDSRGMPSRPSGAHRKMRPVAMR